MLGTNLLDRRGKTQRVVDQAWEQLTNAVDSAGESVRHAALDSVQPVRRTGARLAGQAGARVSTVADEARHRASRAYAALAGRRPGRPPWGVLIGAGLLGVALGIAAATMLRVARRAAAEPPTTDPVEFVDTGESTSPAQSDPR